MTNYFVALAATFCLHRAAPAMPRRRNTRQPAAAAATATALPRCVQAPAGSSLTFTFDQAGAASKGSFKQFATELATTKSPRRQAVST